MRNYPWLNLFQISEKRRLLFAYDMFRLLERNVANQFLLLLPEITLHGYTCIYGVIYLPILIHFSLESTLGLEAQFLQCLV